MTSHQTPNKELSPRKSEEEDVSEKLPRDSSLSRNYQNATPRREGVVIEVGLLKNAEVSAGTTDEFEDI